MAVHEPAAHTIDQTTPYTVGGLVTHRTFALEVIPFHLIPALMT
jgi:hypothetical protein